ncbi:hypothetical protein K435DRAFT_802718 [Dendrothele bispora CBS 962.96]|uniref:Uncharacterized protein n=1 Tax=Dendrothele bispora (strain CBS 962.96) TaxID=1314807 RepID=A0A4S8LKI8_DENBC|nr:hypothetical protein K435DRAFT_802718 [Dendrothele bispora CBS 962.96]
MPSRCEGCQNEFTGGAFLQHIHKTLNPLCQAFGEQIENEAKPRSDRSTATLISMLLGQSARMPASEQLQMGAPMEINPQGDYFGDYNNLEADTTPDCPPSGDVYDASSSSDSDLSTEYEDGWEPDWDTGIDNSDGLYSRSPSPELSLPPDNDPITLPPINSSPPQQTLEEPYVQHYPDPEAGEPLSSQKEFLNEYHRYEKEIGRKTNIWAPFTSEIDWRVAKWAKMWGPSSSAFTELLAIDGVADRLGLSYRNTTPRGYSPRPSLRGLLSRYSAMHQGIIW